MTAVLTPEWRRFIAQVWRISPPHPAEELDDTDRLDLTNIVASARLEGPEVSAAIQAMAIEFLTGRLDGDAFERRVLETALGRDTSPSARCVGTRPTNRPDQPLPSYQPSVSRTLEVPLRSPDSGESA